MHFSVCMSVYGKDHPQWFEQAVESVINQTVKPDEFVLVVDGPVPAPLDAVISKLEQQLRVRVMRLPANQGHGVARRIGLEHCSYELAEDELLLLIIGGICYFIADITLRMLTPRELYNAMSFPADYIIDRDYLGREYKKTKQVERCGNAVCPALAYAVVWANFPEWRKAKIDTMAQFHDAVAV